MTYPAARHDQAHPHFGSVNLSQQFLDVGAAPLLNSGISGR
ncbi:hypothetical protein PhiBTCVTUL1a_16 [Burkholderia phage phiBtTUL1a]|nr:hypothetical protein PhiBTCVTUL1a_16 [Burkholderia phage phiBtTUL1a]